MSHTGNPNLATSTFFLFGMHTWEGQFSNRIIFFNTCVYLLYFTLDFICCSFFCFCCCCYFHLFTISFAISIKHDTYGFGSCCQCVNIIGSNQFNLFIRMCMLARSKFITKNRKKTLFISLGLILCECILYYMVEWKWFIFFLVEIINISRIWI